MKRILIFDGFGGTALSVGEAILPIAILFLIFQTLWLKLPRAYVLSVLKGTMLASLGLLLFLQGVHIGLLPFGTVIGKTLATLPQRWSLAPFGFLLGFFTTWGEPSVRILANQVEEASTGSIRKTMVLLAICIAVGIVVGFGFFRIVYDFPLLYLLIPGYLLAIVIMWFGEPEYVSIAVDAGGVATGPMANTFLLSLALGISSKLDQRDPLIHGLGLLALIALAPIISVMVLGYLFKSKNGNRRST